MDQEIPKPRQEDERPGEDRPKAESHEVKLKVRFTITDKDGNVIRESEKEIESYTKQWMVALRHGFINDPAGTPGTDTGGTARARAAATVNMRYDAAAGDSTYGLVVGSGTDPVTVNDYKLQTQILHGLAAGLLDHKVVTFTTTTVLGSSAVFKISRAFVNSSGAQITVRELGLYEKGNSSWIFCSVRDLTPSPVVVDNTKTLTAEFTFTISA